MNYKTEMKKYFIISTLVGALFFLSGCSAQSDTDENNPVLITEEPAVISETEDTERYAEETEAAEQNGSLKDVPVCMTGYIPEKFHVYEDMTPYTEKGTGKERPENYFPSDYYYFGCEDVQINDPELKSLTDKFIADSRAELDAECRKFTAFNGAAEQMYTTADISVLNKYIFITVKCQINTPDTGYYGTTGVRCAYFDAESKCRLELSDLFFRNIDFMKVINQDLSEEYSLKRKFGGINKAVAEQIGMSDYYGNSLCFTDSIIDPYGELGYERYIYNIYDLAFDSVLYQEPVKLPEDILTAQKYEVYELYQNNLYFDYKPADYPGFAEFPYRSRIMSEDDMKKFTQKVFEDIGYKVYFYNPYNENNGYLYSGEEEPDPDTVKCPVEARYIPEGRLFEVTVWADPAFLMDRHYYSMDTFEKLDAKGVLKAFFGDEWELYAEDCTVENINELKTWYIYDYKPDKEKNIHAITINLHGPDNIAFDVNADYIKDGEQWILRKKENENE